MVGVVEDGERVVLRGKQYILTTFTLPKKVFRVHDDRSIRATITRSDLIKSIENLNVLLIKQFKTSISKHIKKQEHTPILTDPSYTKKVAIDFAALCRVLDCELHSIQQLYIKNHNTYIANIIYLIGYLIKQMGETAFVDFVVKCRDIGELPLLTSMFNYYSDEADFQQFYGSDEDHSNKTESNNEPSTFIFDFADD